jgi:hypothetical protein
MDANNHSDQLQILKRLGADKVSHLNGSLAAHLQGTYDLLHAWGNNETLCLAGLYHAIYSTDGFAKSLVGLTDRKKVVELIGIEVEALVYFYCACDRTYTYQKIINNETMFYRDRFSGEISQPSPMMMIAFCELTFANELEIATHDPHFRQQYGARLINLFEHMKSFVSENAYHYFKTIFKQTSSQELTS